MNSQCTFEARLYDQYRAYQLMKRKLRTAMASKIIKNLRPTDLRNIYHAIHKKRPQSGMIPTIEAIPQARESFLYMALFASIYRSASRVSIKSALDLDAIIFAWDYFCTLFPNHIRERRPFGRIRPANFDEAWVIILAINNGFADMGYCTTCHRNFLIIHGSKYLPVCQICAMNNFSSVGQPSGANFANSRIL